MSHEGIQKNREALTAIQNETLFTLVEMEKRIHELKSSITERRFSDEGCERVKSLCEQIKPLFWADAPKYSIAIEGAENRN